MCVEYKNQRKKKNELMGMLRKRGNVFIAKKKPHKIIRMSHVLIIKKIVL